MPAAVAASALAVPDSRVRELAEIAMGMDGVYKLYFGESDLPTPGFIKRAAEEAMAQGYTYYTENAGLPSLREAIAGYCARLHGAQLDPGSEIAVTASGVQALSISLRCLVNPGEEALVLTPAWPNGSAILSMSHAVVKQIPQPFCNNVLGKSAYGVDFDALEVAVTPRTRLLLYTSPSNPLGWVATPGDQARLLDFARKHNLWLIADEVYERLYYQGAVAPSILRLCSRQDAVVVIQSFSKAWCMTGWRLGWLAGRRDLIARASRLNEFMVSCPVAFVQKAAEAALEHGEEALREMLERLRENRDLCLAALDSMPGVTTPVPDGAFYLFPQLVGVTDSFDFAKRLLVETKVGVAPGVAFGAGGEGRIRLCYAAHQDTLEGALERLSQFWNGGRSGNAGFTVQSGVPKR